MKTALNRAEARKILVQDSSQTSGSGQTDVETLYEEERDRNKVHGNYLVRMWEDLDTCMIACRYSCMPRKALFLPP